MKNLYVLIIILFVLENLNTQTQIGQDIEGNNPGVRLGQSVSLSTDGTIVATGAIGVIADDNAVSYVSIYENHNGSWVQLGNNINGEVLGDQSGYSVSLSSDGSIVAIGSPFNNENGGEDGSGHVRVYEYLNNNWIQLGDDIEDEDADQSGYSVSLSSDGSVVAIGAPQSSSGSGDDFLVSSGRVQIYEYLNGNWVQLGNDIIGADGQDELGSSVSLSSDGTIIAIGAPNDNAFAANGYVRIYGYLNGSWIQLGNDINGEALEDNFGFSVSLSSNGETVAIGAPTNDGLSPGSGHVRIYQFQNNSWLQLGDDIDGQSQGEGSGASVSLSSDGYKIAIGAPNSQTSGFGTGQVKVYSYNLNTTSWEQQGIEINGNAAFDRFGGAISLSEDATTLTVGATGNDGNGSNSGHVRTYNLSGNLSTSEQNISNFKLYPNPTKTQLTIQLDNPSELQSINIYNNFGQLILSTKESTMNTSKLTSGLYLVEVETSKGKGTKKLIIE